MPFSLSIRGITNAFESFGVFEGVCLITVFIICYSTATTFYNLFLHPLSKFPGPIHYRASIFPWAYQFLRGKHPFSVLRLHEKYGPVVRISPSEISFTDLEAWTDIYGASVGNENPKYQKFYAGIAFNGVLSDEFSAAGKQSHKILKDVLANGFSERNLKEKEGIIMGHVNLLIKRLRKESEGASDTYGKLARVGCKSKWTAIDVTDWFSWYECDVIGDLVIGKSFGCLPNLEMTPYISFLVKAGELGGRVLVLWYLGLRRVVLALLYIFGERFLQVMGETKIMLASRMENSGGRNDLIEPIIRAYQRGDLTFDHVVGAANSLITAGSETTTLALSAFAYCIANNPACLDKLINELQLTFDSEDEICLVKTEKLAYLNACIQEALRLYPSVAEGLPRVVPNGGRVIAGRYIPEGSIVSISAYAASHLSEHFREPFEFHPERFLGDKEFANDRLEAFQPFSVGPRSCVGRNLFYKKSKSWATDQKVGRHNFENIALSQIQAYCRAMTFIFFFRRLYPLKLWLLRLLRLTKTSVEKHSISAARMQVQGTSPRVEIRRAVPQYRDHYSDAEHLSRSPWWTAIHACSLHGPLICDFVWMEEKS
ncbi:hypothetical protein NHQ30_003019 [Ciborinia camelliae]|nr:hypothetical protein NHQ30_003019 [Ciborinia camelliae]